MNDSSIVMVICVITAGLISKRMAMVAACVVAALRPLFTMQSGRRGGVFSSAACPCCAGLRAVLSWSPNTAISLPRYCASVATRRSRLGDTFGTVVTARRKMVCQQTVTTEHAPFESCCEGKEREGSSEGWGMGGRGGDSHTHSKL